MQGIKTKPNKKAKTDESGAGGKDDVPDVDDVELEGEKEDKVEVYGKRVTQISGMTSDREQIHATKSAER